MRALAALLLMLPAAQVGAVEIRSLALRVQTNENGSGRATAVVQIEGAEAGSVVVPTGFPAASNFRLTQAPAGTTLAAQPHNGQTLVRIALPEGASARTSIGFELDVTGVFQRPTPKSGEPEASRPNGRLIFRHALLNTEPATIGTYRFEMLLPDGTRAHAIREALPKLRQAEAGPRAQLDGIDGQPGVWLQVDRLVQGETAVVQVELVPRSRSLAWLLIGVALSLLYLVKFRDLIARAG
ncbi:MAG TPA: hypothetical protein PKL08_09495 [Thermoanaerobaculaceae bacterium]|nr:hypothetical protein [Thermoanaerobaculaceae bacterium]